ncbi:hypothetical protein BJ138DRAFT_1197934, partial [Hygrophoropsis aurantiaca]
RATRACPRTSVLRWWSLCLCNGCRWARRCPGQVHSSGTGCVPWRVRLVSATTAQTAARVAPGLVVRIASMPVDVRSAQTSLSTSPYKVLTAVLHLTVVEENVVGLGFIIPPLQASYKQNLALRPDAEFECQNASTSAQVTSVDPAQTLQCGTEHPELVYSILGVSISSKLNPISASCPESAFNRDAQAQAIRERPAHKGSQIAASSATEKNAMPFNKPAVKCRWKNHSPIAHTPDAVLRLGSIEERNMDKYLTMSPSTPINSDRFIHRVYRLSETDGPHRQDLKAS